MLPERTVTLTATDRPHYLSQVLGSLARVRGVGQWQLIVGLEPGHEECASICQAVDFMPVTLLRNEARRGIRDNPFHVLSHAFDHGSRLNIHLEDDTVVSPDVAALADWYAAAVPGDRLGELRIIFLNLFFTSAGGEPAEQIVLSRDYSPWGLVMNDVQWRTHVEPQWWNDDHDYRPNDDWTISLMAYIDRSADIGLLVPRLSRVRNIGREGGVHSWPERFDEYVDGLIMSEDEGPFDYHIDVDGRAEWRLPQWD